jgi:hypothetical protein
MCVCICVCVRCVCVAICAGLYCVYIMTYMVYYVVAHVYEYGMLYI